VPRRSLQTPSSSLSRTGDEVDDGKRHCFRERLADPRAAGAVTTVSYRESTPGPEGPDDVDPPHHVAFEMGSMSFEERGHGIGVTEHSKGLFERLQVFWTDAYGGRGRDLGYHDALVVHVDTFDELREAVAHRPQRST
jgi:hypothetical protein